MGRKIILDAGAAQKTKQQLRKAQETLYLGVIPKCTNVTMNLGGLSYVQLHGVGDARAAANQTLQKLERFEKAFSAYLQAIEKFDSDAGGSIRALQELTEWKEHSGWNANPAVLETRILDKLIAGGMSPDEANAFMAKYKASLIGLSQSSVYCGDPINMSTGNFIYHREDIRIEGAYPLAFVRFYNAVDNAATALGHGWTHNFNITLEDRGPFVQIVFDDGHHEYYETGANGGYRAPAGRYNTLKKQGDGYALTTREQAEYHFAADGKIKTIRDANSNVTRFCYENGLLHTVSNRCGHLVFGYTQQNLLHSVADHTGRVARYEYHNGCLVRTQQPNGAVYQYKYNQAQKIYQIVNPAGVTAITNEYDAANRAIVQHMPDGGKLRFCYEDESLSTLSTEQNGNRVTYVRDQGARTVKIVHADSEEQYAYDENNNRTLFVDRNGNTYRYAYDDHGNLVQATDPLHNTTRFTYNRFAKPLQVCNPDGSTVVFRYDEKGNLVERADPLQRLWKFSYTANGWPAQVTLPDESATAYTYDERGNITSVTDGAGATVVYEYNELNQVVKSVNAEGHATRFAYNERGDIVQSTNAMGGFCKFEYNASGGLVRAVDYCGSETRFEYNAAGKVERVVNAAGGTTRYRYDVIGNMTDHTDPEGNHTRYEYDLDNRLAAVTDPEGNTLRFEHDPNGNIVGVVSADGARTCIEYDAMNRAVQQTEPDGAVRTYEYDSFGRLTATTYQNGARETREYDKAGQLIAFTNLRGETTRYRYTALGQVETVASQNGDELRYTYYPGGRLKALIKPEGETESYVWDNNGNVVQRIDALGNTTRFVYDALDRVVEVINPMGDKKTFAYDPMGRVTAVTDVGGNTKKYRYSALGTLLEVVDADGRSTQYSYDAAKRLTGVEQARLVDPDYGDIAQAEKQLTTYEYNKCGRVTAIRDAMGNAVRYTYDENGRVVARQDEDGFETRYAYNQIGQLAQTQYADGKQVRFRYGELRQLAEMQDWLGTTKIETNAAGQVTRVTQPDGKTMGYEWTELGQRKKTVYPDGSEVEYCYNASGRYTQVNAPGGATQYQYDAAGRVVQRTMPGGIETQYGWDNLGRLTQLVHRQQGNVLDDLRYGYDASGNITQIEKQRAGLPDDSGVFAYAYDALNRLVEARHGGRRRTYAYDAAGNRTRADDDGAQTQYSYNALNQLVSQRGGAGEREYSYDKRGNLTGVFCGGSAETRYSYDAANMLVRAVSAQNGVAEYGYDGMFNRVSKNVHTQDPEAPLRTAAQDPAEPVRYVVDLLKPYNNLVQMETGGGHTQNFIWGKDLLACAGDEAYTYLHDHLGTPARLVAPDTESTPLAFDEFGVPLATAGGELHNPFGFTGYQTDEVSGLYYAQARHYDPATSRMTSADVWAGHARAPQTMNQYAYCLNNPVVLVDRGGNWSWPSFSDILDKGAELLERGAEFVGDCAEGFADFMHSIPDNVVDYAKEVLTPHIENFGNFLQGIDSRVKDVTRTLIRHGTHWWGSIVGHDNLAQWGANALDMRTDGDGIYYADFDCWQHRFGYNDIYDLVFNLGTSMDKAKFEFSCGGEDFVFWAWRGDYLNLGAGAELGIYRRYEAGSDHWDVDKDLAMPMTLRILDLEGNQILGRYPQDPQWWITGFNSNEDFLLMDAEEMIAIYTIAMGDQQDMFYEFYWEWFDKYAGKARDPRLVLNPFAQLVTFTFMPIGKENQCIC